MESSSEYLPWKLPNYSFILDASVWYIAIHILYEKLNHTGNLNKFNLILILLILTQFLLIKFTEIYYNENQSKLC